MTALVAACLVFAAVGYLAVGALAYLELDVRDPQLFGDVAWIFLLFLILWPIAAPCLALWLLWKGRHD